MLFLGYHPGTRLTPGPANQAPRMARCEVEIVAHLLERCRGYHELGCELGILATLDDLKKKYIILYSLYDLRNS